MSLIDPADTELLELAKLDEAGIVNYILQKSSKQNNNL
jgi:hypothetical protein